MMLLAVGYVSRYREIWCLAPAFTLMSAFLAGTPEITWFRESG